MKKYLKIALTILALVLLGYFGYTHFKKTSILLNVIHEDAESVIKIGVHDISKTLVLDALSSPGYYWKNTKSFKKDKKKDSIKDDGIGIDLRPYSIVFYTIKNIDNTFFTTLKIDDAEVFEKYIDKYSKEKSSVIISDAKGYKNLILEKSKLILAWNSEKIAVALTSDESSEKLKTVFEDVLIKDKLISSKDHEFIKKLSDISDHITYINKESLVTLNFEDSEAIVDGTIYTKDVDIYKTNIIYDRLNDPSLQLVYDANFDKKENEITFTESLEDFSFFTKNNIEVNELVNKSDGFLNIGVKGTTMQLDTIVSYEYDDNFEKVAVKTLQEKKAPKILLNLGVRKNNSLNDYLKNQGAITNNVLTSIPYYTFYAEENSNVSSFKTTKDVVETEEKNSPSFFKLDVNFNRLKEDVSIPGTDEIFGLLEALKIEANQIKGTNQIKIKGNISGKKENVNILSQLFFGMQKQKTEVDLDD